MNSETKRSKRGAFPADFAGEARAARWAVAALALASCGRPVVGGASAAGAACDTPEIADPKFASSTAWTETPPVGLAPGDLHISDQTRCQLGGVGQTLAPLPSVCARPLVLYLVTTYGFANPPGDAGALGVRVNGGWSFVEPPHADSAITKVCLGARLFGGAGDLFLGGGTLPVDCRPTAEDMPADDLHISGVEISTPDPDFDGCPPLGVVANGDFEAGDASWALSAAYGVAEISLGVGRGGSRGARIATTQLCQTPSIAGTMSIPTAETVPSPALRFWSRGTAGALGSFHLGPGPMREATLAGVPAGGFQEICIPPWAEGMVEPVSLRFVGVDGHCTEPAERELVLDDLTFVSEPACDASASLIDGGFEGALRPSVLAPFWVMRSDAEDTGGTAELHVDAAFAHTGQVAGLLSAPNPCAEASVDGDVTIPPARGPAGPSVVFWYKTSPLARTRAAATLRALAAPIALAQTGAWTRVTACLDPRMSGRPDRLSFSLRGTGGECTELLAAPETLAVDDVALTTDPACPAIR